jgi:hypothetical protein
MAFKGDAVFFQLIGFLGSDELFCAGRGAQMTTLENCLDRIILRVNKVFLLCRIICVIALLGAKKRALNDLEL